MKRSSFIMARDNFVLKILIEWLKSYEELFKSSEKMEIMITFMNALNSPFMCIYIWINL